MGNSTNGRRQTFTDMWIEGERNLKVRQNKRKRKEELRFLNVPKRLGTECALTFRCGKIGIQYDADNGIVLKVHEKVNGEIGQAWELGVRPGWKIMQIDEQRYDCKLMKKAFSQHVEVKLIFNTQAELESGIPSPPLGTFAGASVASAGCLAAWGASFAGVCVTNVAFGLCSTVIGAVAMVAFVMHELQDVRPKHAQCRPKKCLRSYQQSEQWIGFNIGVVGDAGSGKSSLINRLRNISDKDEDAAKISQVCDCTKEPTPYDFTFEKQMERNHVSARIKRCSLSIWDLPGCNTTENPSKTYIEDYYLDQFDVLIVVAGNRLTEVTVELLLNCMKKRIPCFSVRTRMDLWCGTDTDEILNKMDADHRRKRIPEPYAISCLEEKFLDKRSSIDFDDLVKDVVERCIQNRSHMPIPHLKNAIEGFFKAQYGDLNDLERMTTNPSKTLEMNAYTSFSDIHYAKMSVQCMESLRYCIHFNLERIISPQTIQLMSQFFGTKPIDKMSENVYGLITQFLPGTLKASDVKCARFKYFQLYNMLHLSDSPEILEIFDTIPVNISFESL